MLNYRSQLWARFAEEVGGHYYPGSGRSDYVQAGCGDGWITMDSSLGGELLPIIRVRAPFLNRNAFRFTLTASNQYTRLMSGLRPGGQIAHPSLGKTFHLKSEDPATFRYLFDDPDLCESLVRERPSLLAIRDHEGWTGPVYPEGVDLLLMHFRGSSGRREHLHRAYYLFRNVLSAVEGLLSSYPDRIQRLVDLLNAPSGCVLSDIDQIPLWDGEQVRLLAARLLAEVRDLRAVAALGQALDDRDPKIRKAALRALGRIGIPGAIPLMLPLLGDFREHDSESTSEVADEVLRALGSGAWTSRFYRVLAGNLDGTHLHGEYREPLIAALVETLKTADPQRTVNAARALGGLGAVEAVPWIQKAVQRHGYYLVGIAMDPVLRELQTRAALPRPSTSTDLCSGRLPVPAEPAEPTGELPRTGSAGDGAPED